MRQRKITALLLALAMMCSLAVVPAAAEPAGGSWYDEAMSTWSDRGVVRGDAAGNLNPTANITRAELAVMLERVMGYRVKAANTFTDVADGEWYADAVLKASAAGVLKGDGAAARPGAGITRQEVMVMLSRVLGLTDGGSLAGFADASDVASWAQGAVSAMAAKGYVKGSEGKLMPGANITRAEVVTMLDNIFKGYFDRAGSYTEGVTGSAVVNTGDVTLTGADISGDLIIAEGVGDGHVVLDSVTLGGRLIVCGGGENSIIIKGDSKIDQVSVSRQDGKVRVAVQGAAAVSAVYVDDGSDAVKIEGKVDTVTIAGAGAAVEVAGEVKTVELAQAAEGASLTVAKDAKVGTVTAAAPKAEVAVAGTVSKVETAASAAGAAVSVASGAKVTEVAVAAPNTELSVAGAVSKVDVAASADNASLSTEKGAKVDSVTTNASGTTVEGEKGTVSKVEAGKNATDTTVNAGGAKVENNSSDKVTSGSGAIDPGKTGTAADSSTSKPNTSTGGSTGGGSSGGGHTHSFVDGVCATDGAIDPSYAQVNSADAWAAAVEAGKSIVLTGSFEAAAELKLDKVLLVNGNGKTITSKNNSTEATTSAGILVSAGATIKNLTVSGPNNTQTTWDEGEYGIKIYNTSGVTLENVIVTAANAGIQVNSSNVTLKGTTTVSGNEWGGIEVCKGSGLSTAGTLTINSGATVVCGGDEAPAIWIDGTASDAGVVNGTDAMYTYKPADKNQIYYFTHIPAQTEAKIGNTLYLTLETAIAAAQDSDTVTLLKDTTQTANLIIRKSILLDLNQHKVTSSAAFTFAFIKDGTIKNGTVINTSEGGSAVYAQECAITVTGVTATSNNGHGVQIGSMSKHEDGSGYWGGATINGNSTISGQNGIIIAGPISTKGVAADSRPNITDQSQKSTLVLSESNVTGSVYGITGNGQWHNTDITISSGSVTTTGDDSAAIYNPQYGTLRINGGTIVGPIGIQMCSGKLEITGSPTIEATKATSPKTEGDGLILDSAAVSLVNRSYPYGPGDVTISGTPTILTIENEDAVAAYTWDSNKTEKEWQDATQHLAITGGTYSSDVSKFCVNGYSCTEDTENGVWVVTQTSTNN